MTYKKVKKSARSIPSYAYFTIFRPGHPPEEFNGCPFVNYGDEKMVRAPYGQPNGEL